MKKVTFYLMILLFVNTSLLFSQTNVNGGIFKDTIWSLSNSPYIVTSNIALYPGNTLTIEPGVMVKFNPETKLIVRGILIANATSGNEIIFTSNSSFPKKGSWLGIEIENNQNGKLIASHIKGEFADKFIQIKGSTYKDEVIKIDNSEIENCNYAFYGYKQPQNNLPNRNKVILDNLNVNNNTYAFIYAENFTITNSIFSDGEKGISGVNSSAATPSISNSDFFNFSDWAIDINSGEITDSHIHHNELGLSLGQNLKVTNTTIELNNIGVKVSFENEYSNIFSNNKICNNSQYNFEHQNNYPINITGNFWCSNKETDISETIFDAYNDVSRGIVNFTPIANNFSVLKTEALANTNEELTFFPNPAKNEIFFSSKTLKSFEIYSLIGAIVKKGVINDKLNISDLNKGAYLIRIFDAKKEVYSIKKLIKS